MLENVYIAVPNSDRPMPISVVHLPKKLSSASQGAPSSPWFSCPLTDFSPSPKSSLTLSIPPQYPPPWLDLMVNPTLEQSKPVRNQAALTNAKKVIMGLPLVRRKRSATVTQHPPVYLQRQSSLSHNVSFHQHSSGSHQKHRKPKHSWPVHSSSSNASNNWSGMHSNFRGSKDSLKAGLKKTAQKMMKFRGVLEKSQSFDMSPMKPPASFMGKSSSMKMNPKAQSPVRKLLEKSQPKSKSPKSKRLESLTSPEDLVEEWDLDSPDVEVIGLEEEDAVPQYSDDDDIGQEITNIEYSYKTMSTAFSDPTLNKSIYALQHYPDMSTSHAPIQFISSDEDTCSSDPVSSEFSSPEHEVKSPETSTPRATPQKFYLSEEELTSQSSLESRFTGPVEVGDLHYSDRSFESPGKGQGTMFGSPSEFQGKRTCMGSSEKPQDQFSSLQEPEIVISPSYEQQGASLSTFSRERKTGIRIIAQQDFIEHTDSVADDFVTSVGTEEHKANELRPAILHVTSGTLPDIAVTPSSPVLPLKGIDSRADAPGESHFDVNELAHAAMANYTNSDFIENDRDSEEDDKRSVTMGLSVSCNSVSPEYYSASMVNSPPPPLPSYLHTSYSDSLISPNSYTHVASPPHSVSGYLSSPSSSPSSFQNVASSVSMDGNLLHCVVDVAAKCPSHPMYISSLDMLVDARPGSASMVGSPKRSSRSRHTSGCYPISRSPLPIDADGSKSESGVGSCSVGVSAATVNGGAPTHSPTHSGKLSSPARTPGVSINRRSSDSDLSITPKGK